MPKTQTLQRLPARAMRKGSVNPLAAPRGFGAAAHAPAAGMGHDFARVAVRRNDTGLDDRLKAGIERLSGESLDDVRVHYRSAQPARVQAAAFTQGTHIHVAPGQEHHLAHEAWHVVQQKQGRVRATGRVAGRPLNDSEHLEREASVMGEKALTAAPPASAEPAPTAPMREDAGAGAGATSAPVQAWRWPWQKAEPDPHADLSPTDQQVARLTVAAHEDERRRREAHTEWATGFHLPEVEATTESHPVEKVGTVSTIGSGVLGKGAEGLSLTGAATTGVSDIIGGVASGVGVVSSGLSAASGVRNLATDETQATDKALTTGGVLSDVGSATTTLASGAAQAGSAGWGFAKAAAPVLGKVAGPVAIARGGIDIVRGTAQTGLALNRRSKLKGIEEERDSYEGVARFAKQTQTTKAVSGVGTIAGGALALLGGLGVAGLALSNPVGWGLLAGAAGVGAGMAAYKKYRKYQIGKQLKEGDYQRALGKADVHVPKDEALAPKDNWARVKNFFTASTTAERRYDAVRGHIAQKLAKNEDSPYGADPDVTNLIGHLGLKPKAEPPKRKLAEDFTESSPLVQSDDSAQREEARKKRAKNIARALGA